MRKLKITVAEDGSLVTSGGLNGINGENNASEITFTVPEKYAEFNKFLDVSDSRGNTLQIALSIKKETEFSWVIPSELTSGYGFDAQLVLKSGSEVFKSVLFAVTFGGGINATEYMESEYTDSIELLYETKADKTQVSTLDAKVNGKLSAEIYYGDCEKNAESLDEVRGEVEKNAEALSEIRGELEKKAAAESIPDALSQLNNDIYAVTDKEYVHTDNNFTDEAKLKLDKSASSERVTTKISMWSPGVRYYENEYVFAARSSGDEVGTEMVLIVCRKEHVSPDVYEVFDDHDFEKYWYELEPFITSAKFAYAAYSDTFGNLIHYTYATKDENSSKLDRGWTKLGEKTLTAEDIYEGGEDGVTGFSVPCEELSGYTELSINLQCKVNDDNSELTSSVGFSVYVLKSNSDSTAYDRTVIVSNQGSLEASLRSKFSNNIIVNAYFRDNIHQYSLVFNTNYDSHCYRVTPTVCLPSYYYNLVDKPFDVSIYGVPVNLEDRSLVMIDAKPFKFPEGTTMTVYGR